MNKTLSFKLGMIVLLMLLLLVGRSALLGEVHAGGAYPFEPAE